jgi:hypothetical protein
VYGRRRHNPPGDFVIYGGIVRDYTGESAVVAV